ncbi:TPA: hypothetical protein P1K85_001954 [Klebsiella pneumoniae]|uniref:hypothetical protein n=1 Tax=Klebsiella pneumoniae TaxID=573 RepID=UPI001CBDB095|nr:hypothetical protein [Klebsiella pneumoniae]EKV4338823.1 hypothetical protein [Klebsiella pneumoniae]MBZ1715716.1 hypothetical protein [Klebsiella pneumoniae]MCQ8529489.1 hypothetical protein [Klebsiella pneumoniae]MDP1036396.1 hypothetical protein [Klebsiella pneumoniae]HBQ7851281.1 hypothetical protein [Klebsiella pneumoniae]
MSEKQVVPKNYVATQEDMREATLVEVDESTEKWSVFKMEDGTTIRVKATILNVMKLKDKTDEDGNPVFAINIAPVVSVNHGS